MKIETGPNAISAPNSYLNSNLYSTALTLRFVVTYCLIVNLAGCSGTKDVDVTSTSEFFGGYEVGGLYTLNEDVFLVKHFLLNSGAKYALSPEGNFEDIDRFYSVPLSTSGYEKDDVDEERISGRYYNLETQVVDVLKRGTSIRCLRLVKRRSTSWFFGETTRVVVYAEIAGAWHSGLRVDITDLSMTREVNGVKLSWPNKKLLVHKSED